MRNLWPSYGQNAKMNCNHYKKSESEKQRLVFTSPSKQTILRTLESLTGSMTRADTVLLPRFLDMTQGRVCFEIFMNIGILCCCKILANVKQVAGEHVNVSQLTL